MALILLAVYLVIGLLLSCLEIYAMRNQIMLGLPSVDKTIADRAYDAFFFVLAFVICTLVWPIAIYIYWQGRRK